MSKWAEHESGSEPDSPVNKKSLFTDMFEEPQEGAESPKILQPAKGAEVLARRWFGVSNSGFFQVRGPGLADLMKNRLNRVSVDEVKELKVLKEVDRSARRRSRSQSKSRSRSRRSRSKDKKKKEKTKRKKRSRSRSEQKKKKKKSTEKSFSSSPDKKKKSKHKKHKSKEDRGSRSRSRSKAKKRKKERSRSKSRKQKKRKRSRSSSRRRSKSAETKKRSKSRSRSSERRSKRPRSRSPSRKEEERSSVVRSERSCSRSVSRGPVARSQSRSRRFSRSVSKVVGGSASESREGSKLVGIKEESSEEEDEETIVAKRRLDRLRLVAKLKEKREEEESQVILEDNRDVKDCVTSSSDIPLWPPPPPPLEEEIPCSVYDQENLEKVKEVREEVVEQEAPKASPSPVVVTLDAEVLVVGSRSFLTQLGAFAWTAEPSFQPLSFHRSPSCSWLLPAPDSSLLLSCQSTPLPPQVHPDRPGEGQGHPDPRLQDPPHGHLPTEDLQLRRDEVWPEAGGLQAPREGEGGAQRGQGGAGGLPGVSRVPGGARHTRAPLEVGASRTF